jgi:signal transduction histidine kinase/ActR/RegA family two-component response regulator
MASQRVLVVGRPSALSRELLAHGIIVHHTPMNRRLWSGLASGAWDACVFDAGHLASEGHDLVRHARETQPNLAVFIAGEDETVTTALALQSGADDGLSPLGVPHPASRRVARAIAFRRTRARGTKAAEAGHVLILDWDQLEAPVVREALLDDGFFVTRAVDATVALNKLREQPVDVLLTPPNMAFMGTSIIESALRYDPRLRIIVASDVVDLEGTGSAMGEGAHDYLLRPVGTEQAVGAVRSAWATHSNTSPGGEPRVRLIHVLLLESHAVQARLVEEMLGQEGRFAITQVRDLDQARRRLEERSFDAIIYRPEAGRNEAIRFLHELRCNDQHPAIVLLTNQSDIGFQEQAMRMGVQDIILRQRLGQEALASRVRNAVERNQYRHAHERFVHDLQRREASQQEVVRRSVEGMLIVDAPGNIVFSNPAGERLLSRPGEPLLGQRFPYPLGDAAPREIQVRDGETPCVAEMTTVAIDWNGASAHLISLRDVTERRQAQQLRDRLAHTERLAAIGQLAAGVTHEINNPATYVVANLTTMLDLVADLESQATSDAVTEKLRELGDMVRENLDGMARIRSITSDLRTFARIDSHEVTLVDLNDCVVSACKIAFNEIRHRAHLVQALSTLPRIPGSQGKLAQVVTNLLVNAAQAIPEGNVKTHRVTVRTGATEDGVWLQVEDTGRGIPPHVRERMFDPFFTTKARSQGTGLGLALCADIVRQHQGTITSGIGPDGGTCFEVRLPQNTQLELSSPTTPPPSSLVVPRPRMARRLNLLLIDDEPLVLRSLRRMLSEHHVDTARGGAEALEQLRQRQDYDFVFCDLMMPEMDGTVFYAEVERRMPALRDRIVFCSGGAFTTRTKQFVEHLSRPLMEKPLTREAFERFVAEHCRAPQLKLVGN